MKVKLNRLDPGLPVFDHPYYPFMEDRIQRVQDEFQLVPTIYFPEAVRYHDRAMILQQRNIGWKFMPPAQEIFSVTDDDLQDNVHIYDTIFRWSAGFSNVPQELMLQEKNPKHKLNKKNGRLFSGPLTSKLQMYLLLVHRVTGSGASFADDHGWRNTIIPYLVSFDNLLTMLKMIRRHDVPMFTSIGNQIPSFNKPTPPYLTGGKEYLCEIAPQLVEHMYIWLTRADLRPSIQKVVNEALRWQSSIGWRKFHFVLTAWAMDLAEYFPNLVDENSDCYHGKNAQEAIKLIFKPMARMKSQDFFDRATRAMCNTCGTRPMDMEDVFCDYVRWLENYIQKRGYEHVDRTKVFHHCYIKHPAGRQRWKLGTPAWVW